MAPEKNASSKLSGKGSVGADNGFKVTMIPLSSITVLDRLSGRYDQAPEALAALRQSINDEGLLQTIVVKRVKDDYQLIAGEGRFMSFHSNRKQFKSGKKYKGTKVSNLNDRYNGWKQIPAHIVETNNDYHEHFLSFSENAIRNDLHPLDCSDCLTRMKPLYEELNPETKQGATGGGRKGKGTRRKTQVAETANSVKTPPRFTKFIAIKMKRSETWVREMLLLQFLSRADRGDFRSGKIDLESAISRARMHPRFKKRQDRKRERINKIIKTVNDNSGTPDDKLESVKKFEDDREKLEVMQDFRDRVDYEIKDLEKELPSDEEEEFNEIIKHIPEDRSESLEVIAERIVDNARDLCSDFNEISTDKILDILSKDSDVDKVLLKSDGHEIVNSLKDIASKFFLMTGDGRRWRDAQKATKEERRNYQQSVKEEEEKKKRDGLTELTN